ncbi:MAG: O-antigen ligase family protein [Methylacidiphilales bacterium]|nr:O-antigen ligase family protein [Candidatus Methylacidiphilales bacterium]
MHPALRTKNDLSPARFWVIAITLMALALGGTVELGAQFVIAAATAFILLIDPPRNSLGILPNILFAAFFLLALAAYLPADWFPLPPWRQLLVVDLQLPLPATRTPQPWLTAQACALLFIGLAWAYYLLSQRWNRGQRLQAVYLLVLGVAVLASIAVVAYTLNWHVPGWKQAQNRGWFPNRNQTANVLALAGILNYTLVIDRLRRRNNSGWFWLATLLPIGAALVVSYSRSGILIFFTGIALWHLWPTSLRQPAKWTVLSLSLSLSLILTLFTLFFLFGGDTLARFQSHPDAGISQTADSKVDFRFSIQKDALRFSLQNPWLGIGLGNFEPLFAIAQKDSANQNRALHPESDWLWTACEMGWPAVLLLFGGIGWWLRQCLPFEPDKRGESLRRALVIAVLMFIFHGFVDVSGHRIGSLWFALLLASLALPTTELIDPVEPFFITFRRPIPLLFRGIALLIMVVATWWCSSLNATIGVASTAEDNINPQLANSLPAPSNVRATTYGVIFHGNGLPPTSADLARLQTRIINMAAERHVDAVEELTNAALKIAPIDWTLYFQRAWAEVFQQGQLTQAGADFQIARALEPHWAKHCFDEGVIWLSVNQPDLCMYAWQEALRRDPASRHDLFTNMLRQSGANDLVRKDLADLAATNTDYLLIFLDDATPKEAQSAIARLLAMDPDLKTLNPAQREALFADWWHQGDQADLGARLLGNTDWQNQGWPWLAQFYAQQKDYQHAWQTVAAHATPPTLPADNTGLALADLERSFYASPDNTAAGLILLGAEIKAGKLDDALDAVRAIEKNPDHPAHIAYYEAQLWADKQQWELAWNAWSRTDNL